MFRVWKLRPPTKRHTPSTLYYALTTEHWFSQKLCEPAFHLLVAKESPKIDEARDVTAALASISNGWVTVWSRSGASLIPLNGGTSATGVAVDSANNVYVTGSTYIDLDGNANSGYSDAYITKYDPPGNRQWTRLLGGAYTQEASGVLMKCDSNGMKP